MHSTKKRIYFFLCCFLSFYAPLSYSQLYYEIDGSADSVAGAPLPDYIKPPAEKLIIVDPREHVWGAYDAKGKLQRWGLASAGADWCADIGRSCRTKTGTFRIYSLGSESCVSSKFPLLDGGGAEMPYCMYFNGSEALHGAAEVPYGNKSHGCVRMHVSDAKWLRYHFVEGPSAANFYQGTKVIVRSY